MTSPSPESPLSKAFARLEEALETRQFRLSNHYYQCNDWSETVVTSARHHLELSLWEASHDCCFDL